LPCSIPNLQFDDLTVEYDIPAGKFDAYSVLMIGIKPVLDESAYNTGFADCSIAYEYELEGIVKTVR
jgi:hypothetical protein